MQERLGIAGSGVIACGLAATAACTDEVVMWARSDPSAARARAAVARACERSGADGGASARVHVVTDPAALRHCTFLVEAVIEDQASKASVLTQLASHADPDAVLATTTSSLAISELVAATGRPERFVGLHVFNPVPRMKLVELVFPSGAAEQTRARARALCEALGKTPVEVPDIPGFVVNRLLFPYLFGAVELMSSTGMASADIDRCMTLGAGLPMGPLALLDLVGLDVAQTIGQTIGVPVPERLRAMVEAGSVGRKSGGGFYNYH
ncbi:MAG: 3-hydroxyacyl-CoA dehydrogenase family protein [Solirubrobacteraceae bacterium]